MTRKRQIAITLRSYHLFRRTCDRLVRRLDTVVAAELAAELQISRHGEGEHYEEQRTGIR